MGQETLEDDLKMIFSWLVVLGRSPASCTTSRDGVQSQLCFGIHKLNWRKHLGRFFRGPWWPLNLPWPRRLHPGLA